jgi:signal recognition particle subunit SRP54
MTVQERKNPKIINGSRRSRIAAGAGVTVGEVNSLIVRFQEGQKMMRQMMGGIPGMGGMRRGGQKAKAKAKKKGGGRPANTLGGRSSGGPAGLPAGLGQDGGGGPGGPGVAARGFGGLADGLGGTGLGDNPLRLPGGLGQGFPAPQPKLPPGLRGPVPNRRARQGRSQGKKGR